MKHLTTLVVPLAFCASSLVAVAQTREVKGVVYSATDRLPLSGATINIKGTTQAVFADNDGAFTLKNVPNNAVLVVRYIGFNSQEVALANAAAIYLEELDNGLQEVVVTGYTTQRKADLTGAISTVSVDEMAKQNENNPMKALQGRVPGMNIQADGNPSGAATIRIRGIGILNDNDPLYIIDGVPTKAGMHELNGNDIESIQVLKDAASASIYGSRAANGVIIITTKRGKGGRLSVNFDGSLASSIYTNRIQTMNAREWGRAY